MRAGGGPGGGGDLQTGAMLNSCATHVPALGWLSVLAVVLAVVLAQGRRHVPFHESKLTRLLRGAFGGASRTTCVIAASPDDSHAENTVQVQHVQ